MCLVLITLIPFFKSMFHSLSSYFCAAQITFLFAKQTQTSLILCFTACAESLQGGGRNLSHAAQELFGVGFFPLCSKPVETDPARNWALGKAQGHVCETELWKVPGSGALLRAESISQIRTAEEQILLRKSNQKSRMTLLSSIARDMGFPTIIRKISSTYSSLLQR